MLKKFVLLGIVLSFCSGILIAQGNFWEEINLPATVNPILTSFASSSSGVICAGTNTHGMFKSTDNGSNWTNVSSLVCIESLGTNSSGHFFTGSTIGMYRSIDSGNNWVSLGFQYDPCYALSINSSDDIFLGTSSGIYRSTDNGSTWNITALSTPYIHDICIKPSGDIFVATASDGIYVSRDNGDTWISINTGLPPHSFYITLSIQSIDYVNDTLYCGISGRGVYKSSNNGSNWFQSGLDTSSVMCLAINSNGHIYAGTNGGGVYVSTDHANTWTGINSGLTNDYVEELFITPDGHILAGTQDGLFRSMQTQVGINKINNKIPRNHIINQNYPNPFNPTTVINYQLSTDSEVELSVFDMNGRKVATLVKESIISGYHEVNWDASGYSSGIYFYRLKAGDFVETKKMVFMK